MEKIINYIYSKLIFLFYLEYLRIIVFAINIMLYNWGELRLRVVIKNSLFIIDLLYLLKGKGVKLKNIIKFARYRRVKY